MRHNIELYLDCKRMFIQENKTPGQISAEKGGSPHRNTIQNWATTPDEQTGKTWADLRKSYIDDQYDAISPRSMALKIMQQISGILNKEDFNTKDADALAKLQKSMARITDPRYQIPVMYEMLGEFITFLRTEYSDLVTPDLMNAFRAFKNHLRRRLESI